jgi:hypothetical protein
MPNDAHWAGRLDGRRRIAYKECLSKATRKVFFGVGSGTAFASKGVHAHGKTMMQEA